MYIKYECLLLNPLADNFRNEGYSHFPSVLNHGEVHSLLDSVDHARDQAGARKRGSGIFALRHLLKEVKAVDELASSKRLLDLVRPILGNAAFPVRAVFLDNSSEQVWHTHWHQDLTIAVKKRINVAEFGPWSVKNGALHVQPRVDILSRMVTLRLHLDNFHTKDGILTVLPGSQAQGVITGKSLQHWTTHGKEVELPCSAGDVILIRPLLLHRSNPCQAVNRRIVHIEYAAETLPDDLEWAIA